MNIFLIPSGYPSKKNPLSGIFIAEQAETTARLNSNMNVIVSRWGHQDSEAELKSINKLLKAIQWWLNAKREIVKRNNFYEIITPILLFSKKIPFCGLHQLIRVNKKNLILAKEKLGNIDLIHAHSSYPAGYIAYILSKKLSIPYIVTEHMGPFPYPSLLTSEGKPINEIHDSMLAANAIIAVSPALKNTLEKFGYSNIYTIPNLVDESIYHPNFEKKSNKFTFLTLCGMVSEKGIDTLLNGIALWKPDHNKVVFIIAGDGPLLSKYKQMAIDLNIDQCIRWLGHIPRNKAASLFKSSHSFVLASKIESFGIVYAEAIACGIPIIATRCGGPESIVTNDNGLLIEINDPIDLSKKLQFMYENYNIYSADTIVKGFMNQYSSRVVVKKITDIYLQYSKASS